MGDRALECLAWIANPAREPVSVVFLVSMRVASFMSLFASMILWTLACIYRPWKLQIYKGTSYLLSGIKDYFLNLAKGGTHLEHFFE